MKVTSHLVEALLLISFSCRSRAENRTLRGSETSSFHLSGPLSENETVFRHRQLVEVRSETGARFDVSRAPAPLFRDPLYDGAADPTVVWDDRRREWRVFYTQRRARGSEDLPGVSWAYGTAIGMATSSDAGATWRYQGTCKGLDFESGLNTFWAPDVVRGLDGVWHMHVTYVRRVRLTWGGKQMIAHLTSSGDLAQWTFKGFVEVQDDRLSSGSALSGFQSRDATAAQALQGSTELLTKVIDADVRLLPDGRWKIWYKDLKVPGGGTTWSATTTDPQMRSWVRSKNVEVENTPSHEAPVVFEWKGFFWLVVDPLNEEGLRVYRSTDASSWSTQPHKLLAKGGHRGDDGNGGSHADVVVTLDDDRAYMFYFVHPVKEKKNAKPSVATRRTSLQVAELTFDGRWLNCDRDRYNSNDNAGGGGGFGGFGGFQAGGGSLPAPLPFSSEETATLSVPSAHSPFLQPSGISSEEDSSSSSSSESAFLPQRRAGRGGKYGRPGSGGGGGGGLRQRQQQLEQEQQEGGGAVVATRGRSGWGKRQAAASAGRGESWRQRNRQGPGG